MEGPGIVKWQGNQNQVLVGEWNGPTPEGYGFVVNDHESYIGHFKNGKFEGQGKRKLKDDSYIWEGKWLDG